MCKPDKKLNATEMLEILSQQWAEKKDIMSIGYIGDCKASNILKEITEEVKKTTGKNLPRGLVPMKYVMEYFGIDINYLKKMSKSREKVT